MTFKQFDIDDMFNDILVLVNEDYWEAAKIGYELAADYDARLHGLYVNERFSVLTAATAPVPLQKSSATEKEKGTDALHEFVSKAPPRLDVDTTMEDGDPAQETSIYIREQDIDIVVSHREDKSQLRLIGSVSDKLARAVDIPVLVVPVQES